jgi:hypothetical protein
MDFRVGGRCVALEIVQINISFVIGFKAMFTFLSIFLVLFGIYHRHFGSTASPEDHQLSNLGSRLLFLSAARSKLSSFFCNILSKHTITIKVKLLRF